MRHLATLPQEAAQTLADYLLTLKIQTQLERDPDGMAVWVRDEDQLNRARQELDEFKRNPEDPRYRAAAPAADALRRQEQTLETNYRKRQRRMQKQMQGLALVHQPLTNLLLAVSVVVTLATNFGSSSSSIAEALYITSFRIENHLIWWIPPFTVGGDVRAGEVWRLITPIFIHLGFIHLLFNMSMLLSLGGAVEHRRGSLRLLCMVLVLAVVSNLGQYYLGGSHFQDGWIVVRPSPRFGGMSGVLYGLFGYLWMKSRFEPELGLGMPRQTVLILIIWFFCCWLIIPDVANVAHTFGLLAGLAIGVAPPLWRRLRGK